MPYAGDDEDDDFDIPDENDDDSPEDTIVCPHCGDDVYVDAMSCSRCGEYISRKASSGVKPWWLILGAAAGIAVMLRCI